jgi:hypothetical protein
MDSERGKGMSPFTKIFGDSLDGGLFGAALKIVFGLLLSVLSFSAFKLYDRMECAERSIVQLQITDAARSEKLTGIDSKLSSIERKLDKIVDGNMHGGRQ